MLSYLNPICQKCSAERISACGLRLADLKRQRTEDGGQKTNCGLRLADLIKTVDSRQLADGSGQEKNDMEKRRSGERERRKDCGFDNYLRLFLAAAKDENIFFVIYVNSEITTT